MYYNPSLYYPSSRPNSEQQYRQDSHSVSYSPPQSSPLSSSPYVASQSPPPYNTSPLSGIAFSQQHQQQHYPSSFTPFVPLQYPPNRTLAQFNNSSSSETPSFPFVTAVPPTQAPWEVSDVFEQQQSYSAPSSTTTTPSTSPMNVSPLMNTHSGVASGISEPNQYESPPAVYATYNYTPSSPSPPSTPTQPHHYVMEPPSQLKSARLTFPAGYPSFMEPNSHPAMYSQTPHQMFMVPLSQNMGNNGSMGNNGNITAATGSTLQKKRAHTELALVPPPNFIPGAEFKRVRTDRLSSVSIAFYTAGTVFPPDTVAIPVSPNAFPDGSQSLTLRATSTTTGSMMTYRFIATPPTFPAKKKSGQPAWIESGLQAFFEQQVIKGSKSLTVLGSELMMMTQEEAARRLGISSTRLCRKWSQTMAPRKWPYRTHIKIEREMHQLRMNYTTNEKPAFVKRRLDELEAQRATNMDPAFILI
eukprot:TRINITY_DN5693_c1_g1_i2.p1 TRINITY_DN5693_c1_g1~~TRINITY_DN5693_c1_g1_i2.p1  ORF type:complete len:472 (-),score=106.58 TRINITY_DN5693_c1_g1_i2:429-1844(-)